MSFNMNPPTITRCSSGKMKGCLAKEPKTSDRMGPSINSTSHRLRVIVVRMGIVSLTKLGGPDFCPLSYGVSCAICQPVQCPVQWRKMSTASSQLIQYLFRFYYQWMFPKDTGRMANSEDPNQTATAARSSQNEQSDLGLHGHFRAPYHKKSLDAHIDKLLATKINNGVEPVQSKGEEPDRLIIDCDSLLQDGMPVLPSQNGVRGEAISPQAADVVNQVLGNVTKPHQPPLLEKENPGYRQTHLQSNVKEHTNERLSDNEDNHRVSVDDNKQYNNDSRYQFDSSNLSINSDEIDEIDREALEPDRDTPPQDFSQKLPPTSFSSNFNAEEARLRYSLDYAHADLKERFKQYSAQFNNFNEEEWKRRFSLPDSRESGKDFSLSDPTSPNSKSLSTSPRALDLLRGQPRVLDEPDYALTPRVKEGIYFCHLCSFSGTTQGDFDLHMTCHFEHVCPHCDYKSRTEGRLKRHIKDFHTDDGEFGNRTMPGRPKVFKCKQCDFSTTEKIDFWTHSRRHIKEDKLLQCPRCPFVTEYKHHLEYHLRNHFGSKPFKCPKCNYACVNKSMLNSHMKSHTNVYQYRCSDCTYATKYCHSLKLHLRKYNHKPAAVLNSDGSLPSGMDATASGLSLLSKRGPPRGPRGPRKDKMDPMAGHFLQMGASPMNRLPQGHPGMMSPYWPLLHNQMPNGMQFPFGLSPRLPGLPPLPGPRENPIIKEEMSSPPGTTPYKCNFCSFVGGNREVLTAHIVKAHASENQDLFSMFGISSEALLEENQKRMNALKSPLRSPSMFNPHLQLTPGSIKVKSETPDEVVKSSPHSKQELFAEKSNGQSKDHMPLPPFSYTNGKMLPQAIKDEGIDILKQMTLKFGSGPIDLKASQSGQLDLKAAGSVDSPLDLTKPRFSPPRMYSQQLDSITDNQENRNEEGEHPSGENSTYSNDVASPTHNPRKRSRKGKAFKLDTLCLKLQEKQANGVYPSGEESNDDVDDVYSPEPQDDYIDKENESAEYYHKQRENGEYVYKEREDNEANNIEERRNAEEMGRDGAKLGEMIDGEMIDGDENLKAKENDAKATDEDTDAEVEFKKVRDSLSMLNNESEEQNDLVIDECRDLENKKIEDNEESKIENAGDESMDNEMGDSDQNELNGVNLTFYNKRKPIPSAIQRGVDIAWKMLNNPFINEKDIQNGLATYGNMKYFGEQLDGNLGRDPPSDASTPEKQDDDNPDYMCPHCKIAFGDCIMYTMHMGYHGYKDPYKCNMCGDTCKDRVEFFLHIARAAHN